MVKLKALSANEKSTMKLFTVLLFCAKTGLKEQPERYQTGRGVDYSGYGRYITGESGGKRVKRAAELTGGFPAPEDGAGASVGSSDAGRPESRAALENLILCHRAFFLLSVHFGAVQQHGALY